MGFHFVTFQSNKSQYISICSAFLTSNDYLNTTFLNIAAHWNGFQDNETGILVYTWSVGMDACGDDIHPHVDPHHHLHDESEWTHSAVAYPLSLKGKFSYKTKLIISQL